MKNFLRACDGIRFTEMAFESPVWLGVRSAHTLWYVSDEERRQTERIGIQNVRLILSQALMLLTLGFLFLQTSSYAGMLDKTDLAREHLVGPVKKVHVEISKIEQKNGQQVESLPMPWLSTTYDRKGYRIEEVQIYNNRALDFTSVFIRDVDGALIEGIETDAKGTTVFKWTYRHDPATGVIEENRLGPDGSFFSKTTYRYDASGNLVEENRFPPHAQNHFRWDYTYDKKGLQTEESHYLMHSGINPDHLLKSLNSRRVFLYDKKGILTKETGYDDSGNIVSNKHFEYKYDKMGNWIAQTVLEPITRAEGQALVPTEITHRKITYHE